MSVVIVGGGIAGVSTAAALRSQGYDGEVTLVDGGEFPYDRPPLSKDFLSGARTLEQIALQPPSWYDDQRVRLVNRTTVTALRPAEGKLELSDGTLLPADRVVLATGAGAARPPIPGADSPRVHVLRTAEDADRLRTALVPGARLLVVGAGLIGAESASTAVRLGCEVTLVDPLAVPLAAVLGPELAAWVHGLHPRNGVTTRQTVVEAFTDLGATGIQAQFADGGPAHTYDAVLLGVGMVPHTTLAERAGLAVDRGILVDTGQVTSNPAVLAVGDPARTRRSDGVLLPRAEHWEAAQHDGARAAATILGRPLPETTASWFWTYRHGLHIEGVGHLESAAHTVVRGSYDDPSFAVFGLRDGLVVAAAAVDDAAAVRAARRLIDRRIPADPGRLADPSVNLRSLLRG
ncbi:NAD(P)/FAD-dependent oxidoreductase [Streptomyces arenae]|uniref:NAD(P)/FAD-dependent oxidoreductase n=1 Tax=Streptomyces arenae TaxID=29301 RepID=UPI002657EDAF|nr:FAD-dependent oxidoreductase [Streptomyces arenae]MCG7203680.1 FAD-dependent oxidoreductase [Streptomyces arenae]